MSLPRVCIVSEIFHPEDQGGQGKQAFELARHLIQQGARVRVVTRRNFDGSSRHEVIDGVDITRLPPSGLLKGLGWAAIPRTLYFLAGLFWHLIRHRADYDVLLVQGVKGVLIPTFGAAAFCGKGYVIKIDALAELEHALTPESLARMGMSRTSLLAKLWSGTRDRLLGRAAAVVAISAQIESELQRRFGFELTIARIPNGVALSAAAQGRSKRQLRRELGLPDGDIVVYTGRLSRAKGLLTLMEAWIPIARQHSDAHLLLVGGGDRSFDNCEPQLRDQVVASGLQSRVTFVGVVPDVTPYLAAGDLFIQCSESEGFGMSLVEAMAAGLPSISTPVGVAPEMIVDDDNGWLVPIGDERAVTAVLEQAFASRSRWAQMGKQARTLVQSKFDFTTVAARYVELFEQLLLSTGPAGAERPWEAWLRRVGVLALMCSGALAWLLLGGFEWALEAAASMVNSDGALTEAGQRRFTSWLSGSALLATLAWVLSRARWRQALGSAFKSGRAGGWQLLQPRSDVPRIDTKRQWDTELLEYTHDAIIIWEMEGGGVLYWNRAAEQLYGYPRAQALGQVTHQLLQTQLAGGVGQLEQALARFGVWVGELRHRACDGREVVVDARLAVLAQHSGRWLVLEVNRDLTDAKIAESQRQAAEHQLTEWRGSHATPSARCNTL